jgi:hypothetical protein
LPTSFHAAGEAASAALEPRLLRRAEHRPPGRRRLRARHAEPVAARLVVAVLALVEQEQLGVGAEAERAVDAVASPAARIRGMCSKNAR